MIKDTIKILKGKKSYAVAILWLLYQAYSGGILADPLLEVLQSPEFIEGALQASGLSAVRASIAKGG